VAERLRTTGDCSLFSPHVRDLVRRADVAISNLECCISTRGAPWEPGVKPFHFRAPPTAARALARLGVDCVSLANNHAMDYGRVALADTFDHLERAGVRRVGAGVDEASARAPAVLTARRSGVKIGVLALTDHPADYAAGPTRSGVAYADLSTGVPDWVVAAIGRLSREVDVVLVSPHWGPNLVTAPVPRVLAAARVLIATGATLVAGHSAHVFHGVDGPVLFDLGDFVDDYAVHPDLRNDLGMLFRVTFDGARPVRLVGIPLALECGHTRLAVGEEHAWVAERFTTACAQFGTTVIAESGRLVVDYE
jgi:poly-gamma-glutamate synthesis protein (capsule biosynthesis protein)